MEVMLRNFPRHIYQNQSTMREKELNSVSSELPETVKTIGEDFNFQ